MNDGAGGVSCIEKLRVGSARGSGVYNVSGYIRIGIRVPFKRDRGARSLHTQTTEEQDPKEAGPWMLFEFGF